MDLFIFFALPLVVILLSIVLQKILKCPVLVAITVFAIGIIVSFTAFSSTLAEALIATIIYSIIAFVTAYIVCLKHRLTRNGDSCNGCSETNLLNDNILQNGGNGRMGCCNNNNNAISELERAIQNAMCAVNALNDASQNAGCAASALNDAGINAQSATNALNDAIRNAQCLNNNCGCNNTSGNDVSITANFVPNTATNGRTGSFRGCYRRN